MGKGTTENNQRNLTIRIDKDLLKEYKGVCDKNGFDMSKRIRLWIQKEIEFHRLNKNNLI